MTEPFRFDAMGATSLAHNARRSDRHVHPASMVRSAFGLAARAAPIAMLERSSGAVVVQQASWAQANSLCPVFAAPVWGCVSPYGSSAPA